LIRSIVLALIIAGSSADAMATEAQKSPSQLDHQTSNSQFPVRSDAPAAPVDPNVYRLNHGDVVEFSVRGFPELRSKAMVELGGEVTLPLAGRVRVAGLPLSEAQSLIKKLATPRPLQQRTPDGRESYVALSADDVMITIAEYRPIYALGDIAKPGEVPFRPGMTVRQAIALGGGFDIMRYRLVNPFTESADLKGTHEVLWTEAARVRARLSRIEAELQEKTELDPDIVSDIPLDRSYLDEIVKTEAETLKRRLTDHAKEIAHMRGLVELNVAKVDTLKEQLDAEIKGAESDQQELDQLRDAQRRGNLPLMRLMEFRRIQLTNSTRVLQTRVQFDQAERDLAEARRNLERMNNGRRTALLVERQDQTAALNVLMAKISANSEKLVHTSLLRSRLVRGPGAKVRVSIHRSLREGMTTIDATEDTPLLPGDTVEVMLENERDVDALLKGATTRPRPKLGQSETMPSPAQFIGSKVGATHSAASTGPLPPVRP
jgi:polysaccharide export outer membrane protein